MKIMFNGKIVGTITTNRSLTIEEALYALGYDVTDADDCEKAYNDGFEAAYVDDMGICQIDTEACEMIY